MILRQNVVLLDPVRPARRGGTALLAGGAARLGLAALRRRAPGGAGLWERTNHAGRAVSRLGGPALVVGTTVGALVGRELPVRARTAVVLGVVGAGAVGLYDDLCETRRGSTARGIRGHLQASADGRLTSGALKVLGLSAVGALAATPISRSRRDALVGGAVLAGYANLANLLDLRPGRCLKLGLLHAPLAGLSGPPGAAAVGMLGAAAALLPLDLREEVMLGDCGANALGTALGVAVLLRYGLVGRLAHLLALAMLTGASERVSFTEVIAGNPVLDRLDRFGRRPAPALRTSG